MIGRATREGSEAASSSDDAPPSGETFARLLHRASELLVRHGDPAAARHHLERALTMCPDHVTARGLLAQCLVELGQFEHALLLFESLDLELPDSIGAKVNVGVVLLKVGRASAARTLLESAVALAPSHRRAWGYLGVSLEQLGLVDEAERAFLAGHHATAARRLRERHAPRDGAGTIGDFTPEDARTAMPAMIRRRRTLPPDPWAGASASAPTLSMSSLPSDLMPDRMTVAVTIAPPETDGRPTTTPGPQGAPFDAVEAIPFESLAPRVDHSSTRASMNDWPVLPLLDAALASLLIVLHEASVVVHQSGLVLVGLVETASNEGGFMVRLDTMHALAGDVRRERRCPLAPQPFTSGAAPFARFIGTGKLILQPPRGTRLIALGMDADVAFLREDLVVAFEHTLLCDPGRMQRSSGEPLSLVRFKGDGVIVLQLEAPFLALDVRHQAVTLRTDALVGWVGLLAPADTDDPFLDDSPDDELITVSGEGTLLFRAPHGA